MVAESHGAVPSPQRVWSAHRASLAAVAYCAYVIADGSGAAHGTIVGPVSEASTMATLPSLLAASSAGALSEALASERPASKGRAASSPPLFPHAARTPSKTKAARLRILERDGAACACQY